ncbi:hypothetical protein Godav_022220 [Gossypium davidsonii]|uniref:RNase H type-1 domain-containing protein n=2 Tax=Gossypium TaxID=3633 RepID=A0A7J8T7Y9_GOSDV|nr:hypothetical protein [Gossypium davidsonii]MBA0672543.1 hypothetical protein [Gossypium klotzschianum]
MIQDGRAALGLLVTIYGNNGISFVFRNKDLDPRGVVHRSICLAKGYNKSIKRLTNTNCLSQPVDIWLRPPCRVVKINTDGAFSMTRVVASSGVVFRDEKGEWLLGFSRSIGLATVLQSKPWAIYDGLQLNWDRGFHEVIVESDSKEAVELFNNGWDSFYSNWLVKEIRTLCRQQWLVTVLHISRRANKVADIDAKLALGGQPGLQVFPDLVSEALHQLENDALGTQFVSVSV